MTDEEKSIVLPTGYVIKVNSGNLFKTNSENPKAPDYNGTVNVEGIAYRCALWKNDKGYLGIKFTPNKEVEEFTNTVSNDTTGTEQNKNDFDDDIPF